jgi:hypothetical protein
VFSVDSSSWKVKQVAGRSSIVNMVGEPL